MRNFSEIIARKFPDREDIKIYPVADIHLGDPACKEELWQKFLKMVLADKNAYVITAGDLIQNGTRHSVGSAVFDQVYRPREQKKIMAEYLKPLVKENRILCMVGGNHESRTDKDTDSSPAYDIAAKLDIEDLYREDMAFLKLQFGEQAASGEKNPTYTFCVTHGNGSSIYTTSAPVRTERFGMAVDGCDCIIAGHIHKPQDFPVGKYVVDWHNNTVRIKPFEVFICTSWLGHSPYAVKKMMPPTVFRLSHLELRGKKKRMAVYPDPEFTDS